MGGAYTAIVDDVDAPFYNPAGVAGIDHISIHFAAIDLTVSDWVVDGWKTFGELKNPNVNDVNRLMGQNIYVQASGRTAVLAPGFALVGFYDAQAALYAKNQAFPKVEYGYQRTSGIQMSFAYSTTDGKMRGRGRKNSAFLNEWRIGIGGKLLSRTGGYRLLSAAELFSLNDIDTEKLIGGSGSGYGLDIGVQRLQRLTQELTFHFGAAFLNIGDVHFGNGATPLKGDLASGIAFTYKKGIAGLTLAYDLQQINRTADFSKKQNFGARLSLPLLDFYGGIHQGFLTYGAAADIWILRVAGAIYKEEMGQYVKQDTESRFALRVDFKMEF